MHLRGKIPTLPLYCTGRVEIGCNPLPAGGTVRFKTALVHRDRDRGYEVLPTERYLAVGRAQAGEIVL